jgi:ribosomal protein L11 methyltransferase
MNSTASTFKLQLTLGQKLKVQGRDFERDDFLAWLWEIYGERGLLGVHEGTLLSEQAAEQGLETESWTVDAAQAPRGRDWVQSQVEAQVELFFASRAEAEAARADLQSDVSVGEVFEQVAEDWDADWKKSFLNASDGVFIEPFWRILPAWVERELPSGERALRINPGAGFGTGTHETTQLCLRAIGEYAKKRGTSRAFRQCEGTAPEQDVEGRGPLLSGVRVMDFGSGSGILAIAAALLGADVSAVEIDELAIDNALENARINHIEVDGIEVGGAAAGTGARITYSKSLGGAQAPYPLIIANILRPVLVEFAPELVKRLAPGGSVILSGLVQNDVAEVDRVYSALLGRRPQVTELNEWRSLVW